MKELLCLVGSPHTWTTRNPAVDFVGVPGNAAEAEADRTGHLTAPHVAPDAAAMSAGAKADLGQSLQASRERSLLWCAGDADVTSVDGRIFGDSRARSTASLGGHSHGIL
jgi:hypothetical protein